MESTPKALKEWQDEQRKYLLKRHGLRRRKLVKFADVDIPLAPRSFDREVHDPDKLAHAEMKSKVHMGMAWGDLEIIMFQLGWDNAFVAGHLEMETRNLYLRLRNKKLDSIPSVHIPKLEAMVSIWLELPHQTHRRRTGLMDVVEGL